MKPFKLKAKTIVAEDELSLSYGIKKPSNRLLYINGCSSLCDSKLITTNRPLLYYGAAVCAGIIGILR